MSSRCRPSPPPLGDIQPLDMFIQPFQDYLVRDCACDADNLPPPKKLKRENVPPNLAGGRGEARKVLDHWLRHNAQLNQAIFIRLSRPGRHHLRAAIIIGSPPIRIVPIITGTRYPP